ncbi:hypothetical protein D3C73_939120 [compost metagenome]
MRYYLYVDKDFLKSLFAAIGESDFDIGIMEFYTQKSYSTTQDVCVEPSVGTETEEECGNESAKSKHNKKEETDLTKESGSRNSSRDRQHSRMELSLDQSNTYQMSMSRRYINIEDISQIRNDNFYCSLVEKLLEKANTENNVCHECGPMQPCKLRNRFDGYDDRDDMNTNHKFFKINNTYVWVDANKLDADIIFLSNIVDTIHVLGYNINVNEALGFKVVKAVAMYIE